MNHIDINKIPYEIDTDRYFKRIRLPLGAYQHLNLVPIVEDEYIGKNALFGQFSSAVDEKFVTNYLSVFFTEKAQDDLMQIFFLNQFNDSNGIKNYLKNIPYSEYLIGGK